MKRGIVLEIEGKMATVLTPDGRFLRMRVPREGWRPGEEVTWERGRAGYLRPALALACVLLMLLLPGGLAYQHYWALGPVVAYVSVDINPSLELGIDARERVCMARALNADGEKLLTGLPYRRRTLDRVLSDLTVRAVEHGYLSGDRPGAVLVTVTPAGQSTPSGSAAPPVTAGGAPSPGTGPAPSPGAGGAPDGAGGPGQAGAPGVSRPAPKPSRSGLPSLDPARVKDEAVMVTARLLHERGLPSLVKGLAAGPEVRDEAARLDISPGRLALYLAAREAGIEVTLDQLRKGPVAQVLRQAWDIQVKKARSQGPSAEGEGEPGGAGLEPEAAGQGERETNGTEGKAAPEGGAGVSGKSTPPGGDKTVPGGKIRPGASGPAPGGAAPDRATLPGGEGPGEKQGTGTREGQGLPGLGGKPGEGPGLGLPSPPLFPGLELKEGEEETISPRELLEKVWEKTRVEKELPGLMKKFLAPGVHEKEQSGEQKKSGDR
ncbi:MAG: anti-sigma factor domain-containing protein [Bacillota bacterium]|nr:anti-sigma factor domain-containing protein [Bacillota bacterium]